MSVELSNAIERKRKGRCAMLKPGDRVALARGKKLGVGHTVEFVMSSQLTKDTKWLQCVCGFMMLSCCVRDGTNTVPCKNCERILRLATEDSKP
jgi:hypothetical protein